MYHYLFTNDLRISTLDTALHEAGKCFITKTVPSSSVDKGANNNMTTLGFYFNLSESSNCAKVAAKGEVRKVVLNFIKKFQFPNLRTQESFLNAKNDDIKLAPMRVIIQLLYFVLLSEGSTGYIKQEEIRDFIFYNENVAKKVNPNIRDLYDQIKQFRLTGVLPPTVETTTDNKIWNQQDRQIREMIKILLWSGCVVEDIQGFLKIKHEKLTRSDEADIFEIVHENTFWDESTIENYRDYMDINEVTEINFLEQVIDLNPYEKAANIIKEYVLKTGFEFETTLDSENLAYQEFREKFAPDTLEKIPENDVLKTIFYNSENKNDSLCYWLEFHTQIKSWFGSIAGGSSFKFDLFQRKSDNVWITGSPNKQVELSEEGASRLGVQIRDMLVRGSKIISKKENLDSLSDYEELDVELQRELGKYSTYTWVHKYFHMIFPQRFSTWHSTDWQKHILYASGIKPSSCYYGRSGQLSIIAKYADLSNARFSFATSERFSGGLRQFYRIGTTEGMSEHFAEWKLKSKVAIGWPEIGSLGDYVTGTEIDKKAISEKLVEKYYPSDLRQASRKAGEIVNFYKSNESAIFVAMNGEKLLALGDNLGTYVFNQQDQMSHVKPIHWNVCFVKGEKLPEKSEGLLTTYYQFSDDANLIYLYRKYFFENKEIDQLDQEEVKNISTRGPRTDLIHPLNLIIYGAPGTGKTYSTIEYAMAIIEKRAIKPSQFSIEERKELVEKYENCVKDERIVFTTFHQNYGYEDFIQGIRPDTNSGSINFKKVDGIFKRIADKALLDAKNNYVIIIDEINRGNISRIFGELITLIEEDKRYGEMNQLTVTLPLGEIFRVPNNLYIIGTMNSADKSISLIDTALRRRFSFLEMVPNTLLVEDLVLQNVLSILNSYLKKELRTTDLLIGHSYFIGKTKKNLGEIMNRNIVPLLYEYFYDDEAKIKKALECLSESGFKIDSDATGRIKVKENV
jgi:5-methylcytosine-specific restriction protein B